MEKVEELFLVKLINIFLIITSFIYVIYGGYIYVYIPYSNGAIDTLKWQQILALSLGIYFVLINLIFIIDYKFVDPIRWFILVGVGAGIPFLVLN